MVQLNKKITGYIENVSMIFYKADNIIIADTPIVLIANNYKNL